jgi:Cu/Ag efflux pump CusA
MVPLLAGLPYVCGNRHRFYRLAGVAAEFGVVMLMYLRHAVEAQPALSHRDTFTEQGLMTPFTMAPCCACGQRP